MKKKYLLMVLFVTMLAGQAWAYDLKYGDLYYNITSETTVEVAPQIGGSNNNYDYLPSIVVVPDTIVHNSKKYTVTGIGVGAFYGRWNITSITLPNTISIIGGSALKGCNSLNYNEYDNAYYIGNEENPYLVLVKVISTDITAININSSCKVIYFEAFSNCTNLTSIIIPNSVTDIGNLAFDGCTNLSTVSISDSIINIDRYAFNRCNNLDYNRYDNAYYLGNEHNSYLVLFEAKNKNITSCKINDSCRIINYNAFQSCSNLSGISIPNSVVYIGYSAFEGCIGLKSLFFPNSIKRIGESAFSNSGLLSVTIPNSVTTIGSYAFQGCRFTTLSIPNSIVSIGERAFAGSGGLNSVTIPMSVESIRINAFNCQSLKQIVCLDTIPMTLEYDPFPNTDTIYVPSQSVGVYEKASLWKRKTILPICNFDVAVNSNNNAYGTVNGSGNYMVGDNVTITATPENGFQFTSWSDGNTDNPRIISVTGNMEFTANFDNVQGGGDNNESFCDVNGHTFGSSVFENVMESTCTTAGSYDSVVYCSVCGAELYRETKQKPALGHNFVNYVYNNDATTSADGTETATCERGCGATDTRVKEGTKLATTAVAENAANAIKIYTHGCTIVVENSTDEICVYDAMGRLVGRDVARNVCTITINNSGVYIVKTGGAVKRVVVD